MKKQLSVFLLFVFLTSSSVVYSQEETPSKVNMGLGMGIDYGGIFGARLSLMPTKSFAIFGALGYNFLGAGYNVGGTIKLAPDKRVCPTISAMYGYNAVIKIEGAEDLNKVYYGPSLSLGIEIKTFRKPKNFWNFELVVPIRSSEFKDDIEAIDNNPFIELKSKPLPVGFSIGYHIGF